MADILGCDFHFSLAIIKIAINVSFNFEEIFNGQRCVSVIQKRALTPKHLFSAKLIWNDGRTSYLIGQSNHVIRQVYVTVCRFKIPFELWIF